jgi:hypothetical protein
MVCAKHCCSEADCDAGETCDGYGPGGTSVVKICRPKRQNPGMLAYADSCTSHGECESEACASLTPAGGFPKQCSTTCCEDSDCAVVPGTTRCYPFDFTIPGSSIGYCIP